MLISYRLVWLYMLGRSFEHTRMCWDVYIATWTIIRWAPDPQSSNCQIKHDAPAKEPPGESVRSRFSSEQSDKEAKSKCNVFLGLRKNGFLCYYNHVSRIWTNSAAKWGRAIGHQLDHWQIRLKVCATALRFSHWHQWLSQELLLWFSE